jgi:peptide/nickel transport system substrate-binding protein
LQRPEVDNLIEAAENAQALPEQVQAYRILQAYLFEQLPYVPLWYENNVVAMRARVKNYRLNREGNYDGLQEVGW